MGGEWGIFQLSLNHLLAHMGLQRRKRRRQHWLPKTRWDRGRISQIRPLYNLDLRLQKITVRQDCLLQKSAPPLQSSGSKGRLQLNTSDKVLQGEGVGGRQHSHHSDPLLPPPAILLARLLLRPHGPRLPANVHLQLKGKVCLISLPMHGWNNKVGASTSIVQFEAPESSSLSSGSSSRFI